MMHASSHGAAKDYLGSQFPDYNLSNSSISCEREIEDDEIVATYLPAKTQWIDRESKVAVPQSTHTAEEMGISINHWAEISPLTELDTIRSIARSYVELTATSTPIELHNDRDILRNFAELPTTPNSAELDNARGVVRSFAELAAGWDGPDSSPALPGVIDDALEVLQNWPADIDVPEPDMAFDGTVALELYDEKGFTRGGIEFKGNHRAVYTVIFETEVLKSGTFDATLLREIIWSIQKIRKAISAE